MWEEIQQNIARLGGLKALTSSNSSQAVTYSFPLQLAPGLPDYAGFRVSAFADHNPAAGQVLDYNNGTRTYDGHRGTDYALYPFNWNKVDAGEMQVISAADGTLVAKANVDPTDHNCGSGSSDPWNYVAIVHSDGRMTIYGHMRYNSLTTKSIGEMISRGEYLGTVASSGNSTGPHLHFEARYGNFTAAEWFDPYAGVASQPDSWWSNQRPYFDAAVNKLATHSAPPSTPNVCQPSITNLQDSFTTPRNIYFYTFYRDYLGALPTQLNIYRPDGTLFQTTQYFPGQNFYSSWNYGWVVNFSTTDPAGTWRFEANYNGQTYETFFNVDNPTSIAVQTPNGGEEWPVLLPHLITWVDNLGGTVNIALYHHNIFVSNLAYNISSNGQYLWTPADNLTLGAGYSIRVSSVINPSLYDDSNNSFTLVSAPLLAQADVALTLLDTPVTIYPLDNDVDPNGEEMTITHFGLPSQGTVQLVDSHFIYTPTAAFLGTDIFTYTVSTLTNEAESTVTVVVADEFFTLFLPAIWR